MGKGVYVFVNIAYIVNAVETVEGGSKFVVYSLMTGILRVMCGVRERAIRQGGRASS